MFYQSHVLPNKMGGAVARPMAKPQ